MRSIGSQTDVIVRSKSQHSYIQRMRIYFAEMFPLSTRTTQAVAFGFSYLALLSMITKSDVNFFRLPCIIGIIDVFLITLILRLMDELKDLDIDRTLFSHRPVPSGRVMPSDIRVSLGVIVSIYVCINIMIPSILIPALIMLGYSALMFAHFFSRARLRKSLILSLVSHNPVVALMLVHLSWSFVVTTELDVNLAVVRRMALGGIMYWCVLASWELSRKIRSLEEETAYVTYSRVLGMTGAVVVTVTIQSVGAVIGFCLAADMSASPVYYLILSLGYILVLAAHIRFLAHPSPHTNKLRKATEIYAVMVFLAQIVQYVITISEEA